MTLRSRIFSSLLAAVFAATALSAAVVSGTVSLSNSRVDSVARGRDYSGIVVSLQASGRVSAPISGKHVTMLQKNKMFTPHILAVETGSIVDFPNGDPIFHNAFSSYNGQVFDVGLYPPGTSRSVRFQRPGIVRVFCNIHPSMSAIILVLGTPWFTITPRDGSFHLDVPPGTYDLGIFHERATEETLGKLSRKIVVPPEGLRLPALAVSEAGYLPAPHFNKYGKEYDPPPDDRLLYPGSRQ